MRRQIIMIDLLLEVVKIAVYREASTWESVTLSSSYLEKKSL